MAPEVFFEPEHEAEAKRICRLECPVKSQCQAYAVEQKIDDGVWGGLNPKERANIAHRAKKARWRARRAEQGLEKK